MKNKDILKLVCANCNKEYETTGKSQKARIRKGIPTDLCPQCMKKYATEKTKETKKNMSPERKALYYQRLSNSGKKYWANIDEETANKRKTDAIHYLKEWENNATEDELNSRNEKRNETKRNWSDERKREVSQKQSKGMKNHWDSVTDDYRLEFGKTVSDSLLRLPPEKRVSHLIARAAWWNSLTPEEQDQFMEDSALKGLREYWDNISEIEKSGRMKILNDGKAEWWANLTQEEKDEYDRKRLVNSSKNNRFNKRFEAYVNHTNLENDFIITPEVVVYNDNLKHFWDYGVYDKQTSELVAVIDLDGSYFHADGYDYDDIHSKEEYDERRGLTVPNNIKTFIIMEDMFNESFDYMMNNLYKKYDEFINEKLYQFTHMKFPFPNYTDKMLNFSWKLLSKMKCFEGCYTNLSLNTRFGDMLIYHFHPSIYTTRVHNKLSPYETWQDPRLLRKCLEDHAIYQTMIESNKSLQGFNAYIDSPKVSIFSAARAKLIIYKYLNEFKEIFDPFCEYGGRLLGALSLNKKYIGCDIYDTNIKENMNMVNYLNLQNNIELHEADVLLSHGKYECLFTSLPFGDKIDWHLNILTCDEWIDECLQRFDCKRYIFITDNKINKYLDCVVDVIYNRSHLNHNLEYVVLIDK